jgi:hypothetical protein
MSIMFLALHVDMQCGKGYHFRKFKQENTPNANYY